MTGALSPVLHRWLLRLGGSPAAWLAARARYRRSLAAVCVGGWALGIADRAPRHLLLDSGGASAGEVVLCDLQAPEAAGSAPLPFRLTREMLDALGVDGALRDSGGGGGGGGGSGGGGSGGGGGGDGGGDGGSFRAAAVTALRALRSPSAREARRRPQLARPRLRAHDSHRVCTRLPFSCFYQALLTILDAGGRGAAEGGRGGAGALRALHAKHDVASRLSSDGGDPPAVLRELIAEATDPAALARAPTHFEAWL